MSQVIAFNGTAIKSNRERCWLRSLDWMVWFLSTEVVWSYTIDRHVALEFFIPLTTSMTRQCNHLSILARKW
ncbi:hypothetical protein [Dictyobacter alpinus]|uniref:hypothetical protein n=1 Tax=Dictyobacter alpinus TaxID=2014873 RepID=UPI000F835C97|nr:hypothetical protein [Dictyobacter alpinus]